MHSYLTDPANEDSVPNVIANMRIQKDAAESEGLALLQYEGLRHYLHGGVESGEVLTALLEFARSEHDADLALRIWNAWEQVGDGPLMVFSDIGPASNFGAWSLVQHYGDTSPYAEMLTTLNHRTRNWWGANGDYRAPAVKGATDYSIVPAPIKPVTVKLTSDFE